jgi:putative transcriptional regulator
MGEITIRTTVDGTMVDGAAVSAGPQIQEPVHEHRQKRRQELQQERRPKGKPPPKEDRVKVRPMPRVKTVRRALGLTQEEFAARYGIPLGTLRDWEQGRTEPDQPARAYIRVIASNPEWVCRALAAEP